MSKKHFIAITEVIRKQIEAAVTNTAYSAAEAIARDFARIVASDNPRFDTQRFLRACGINS